MSLCFHDYLPKAKHVELLEQTDQMQMSFQSVLLNILKHGTAAVADVYFKDRVVLREVIHLPKNDISLSLTCLFLFTRKALLFR